jgi:hypothetical protein
MSYKAAHPELYEGKAVGTGQCVAYVQAAAGAPSTATWMAGEKVRTATHVDAGTVIATMVDGHYPNHSSGNHAAIYISHDEHGIRVWDQWSGHAVSQRVIRYHGGTGSASNDGDAYYVVE